MKLRSAALALASLAFLHPAAAEPRDEIVVGYIVSTTGPGASLGVHYRNAQELFPTEVGGVKVRYIVRDDGSDTTAAVNIVRRFVSEDQVDLIIGPTSATSASAIMPIVNDSKVTEIATSPVALDPRQNPWSFSLAQSGGLMMQGVADHMARHGIKKVAFIGFSDTFGDQILNGFKASAAAKGIVLTDEERYARADTSVQGQVLRAMASKPDAVLIGGSGSQGALPGITLKERGFAGPIYNTHGSVNPDFLRVGGASVEGEIAPTGPVSIFDELPAGNGAKAVGTDFMTRYLDRFGAQNRNAFAGYGWDGYLVFAAAAKVALAKARPGTPEFRSALRDAVETNPEIAGAHGPIKMSAEDHYGRDIRSTVLVQVKNGQWHLAD